jgi:NAD-dependent deacetylase
MNGAPSPAVDTAAVSQATTILSRARSVLFVTGAGMSADSGLPTYRGVGGLYDSGTTEEGLPIEVLLSGQLFARRPDWTWKYLSQIERACRGAGPNRGHEVLALLERRLDRCVVLTQNVDGFHRRAGSTEVIEIHGNLHDLACTACAFRSRVDDYSGLALPPLCPRCNGIVRPEVVLFGEMLPHGAIARLERELSHGFDAVFTIGTTSVFPYISAPVMLAKEQGIPTVEINPGESEVSDLVDVRIRAGARDALDAIWKALGSAAAP